MQNKPMTNNQPIRSTCDGTVFNGGKIIKELEYAITTLKVKSSLSNSYHCVIVSPEERERLKKIFLKALQQKEDETRKKVGKELFGYLLEEKITRKKVELAIKELTGITL